jgi:hypothetical protein
MHWRCFLAAGVMAGINAESETAVDSYDPLATTSFTGSKPTMKEVTQRLRSTRQAAKAKVKARRKAQAAAAALAHHHHDASSETHVVNNHPPAAAASAHHQHTTETTVVNNHPAYQNTHMECPTGKFSKTDTECDDCPVGKYGVEIRTEIARRKWVATSTGSGLVLTFADSSCTGCSAGRFQHRTGALSCVQCKPGTSTEPDGHAHADRIRDGSGCQPCVPGRFQDTASNITRSCLACDHGKFASAPGSTGGCMQCLAGRYTRLMATAECKECPAGKHGAAPPLADPSGTGVEDTVEAAAGGGAGVAGTTCTPCTQGQFMPFPGAQGSGCYACKLGSFAADRAATACTACPAGMFGMKAIAPVSIMHCQFDRGRTAVDKSKASLSRLAEGGGAGAAAADGGAAEHALSGAFDPGDTVVEMRPSDTTATADAAATPTHPTPPPTPTPPAPAAAGPPTAY